MKFFHAYDLVDEQAKKVFYFQRQSVHHLTGLFRMRVLTIGLITTAVILIIISLFGDISENVGEYNCWDMMIPYNYIDNKHPKGYRTILVNELDTNSLIITGRNHLPINDHHDHHHSINNIRKLKQQQQQQQQKSYFNTDNNNFKNIKHINHHSHHHHHHQTKTPTNVFTIHAHLESKDIIVADFSPIGGAPALHGQCNKSNGSIKWSNGHIWKRCIKLSELILTTNHLAVLAGSKIKQIHNEHEESIKKKEKKDSPISSSNQIDTSTTSTSSYSMIKSYTDEGVIEPVTIADIESNNIFIAGLKHRFPGLSIFTEEEVVQNNNDKTITQTKDEKKQQQKTNKESKDYYYSHLFEPISSLNMLEDLQSDPVFPLEDLLVTIDPLDATKEFTENLLEYVTTQQCVLYKGKPILGVIHQPFQSHEPTTAAPTIKQVFGGDKTKAVDQGGVGSGVVVMSRSHSGDAERIVSEYFPNKQILKAGGAGYKALLVHSGEAEAYLHATKSKIWDMCAPNALLEANGGKLTDTFGEDVKYNPENPVLFRGVLGTSISTLHSWYLERLNGHEVSLSGGGGKGGSGPNVPKGATLLKGGVRS